MSPITRFKEATDPIDFARIAQMADVIWREHYTPIIGKAQVDYMLERFQSAEAIARQVADGMAYYMIPESGETPVGYLAIQKRGRELFLSKIYLLKEFRGRGLGKAAMEFITEKAHEFECDRIALTVNRNNHVSIQAYLKMGFENKGALVTEIGGGFIMDDYRMVSTLNYRSSDEAGSSPV
jgi:RimJ/RimL family protein N-acetyltransferase